MFCSPLSSESCIGPVSSWALTLHFLQHFICVKVHLAAAAAATQLLTNSTTNPLHTHSLTYPAPTAPRWWLYRCRCLPPSLLPLCGWTSLVWTHWPPPSLFLPPLRHRTTLRPLLDTTCNIGVYTYNATKYGIISRFYWFSWNLIVFSNVLQKKK